MLLVCFLRLILHLVFVFICFGESIRWLKIAGVSRFTFHVSRFTFTFHVSFRSLVGHLQYFMGASCKVRSPWRTLPVRPDETARWEKVRCSRYGGALSSLFLYWELTHVVLKINFFFSSVLFRSTSFVFRLSFSFSSLVFRRRRRRRTLILHLFYLW